MNHDAANSTFTRNSARLAARNFHNSGLFSDAALANLLDRYPREHLGIYTFPTHAEGRVEAIHGRAPNHTGEQLLAAVKNGRIWLNLRAANKHLSEYADLSDEIFDQLETDLDERTFKRDVGVLISSPNIHVHYHLDIPLVQLIQVRGHKTLHVYPATEPFITAEQVEAVALKEREEDITFQNEFDHHVQTITLKPGDAVTWDQNAPHRVQNGDMLNVSLSCEFMTTKAMIRANAIYANGILRRSFAKAPKLPNKTTPLTVAKAALARIFKFTNPRAQKGPTPITFELDETTNAVIKLDPTTNERPTITFEKKSVTDLNATEVEQWRTLCAATPDNASPLLTPDFARTIATTRGDVVCVLAKSNNEVVAALAVHQRDLGHCRPVGAPFDDYSGPVIAPGYAITLQDMITGTGLHSYRANASIAGEEALGKTVSAELQQSFVARLNGMSSADYIASRKALHGKRFKNFRRLSRRLDEAFKNVELIWGAPTQEQIEKLFSWKSRQFEETGLLDVTTASQSRTTLNAVAQTPFSTETGFGGFMIGLVVDGKLIAAHFGARWNEHFHPWISAFDPDQAEHTPGILLLLKAIEQMDAMGLETYDLAGGHDHYKKYFADPVRTVHPVIATRATLKGAFQKASFSAWELAGASNDNAIAARLRRRLDHIAACEPRLTARVSEFGKAVAKRR